MQTNDYGLVFEVKPGMPGMISLAKAAAGCPMSGMKIGKLVRLIETYHVPAEAMLPHVGEGEVLLYFSPSKLGPSGSFAWWMSDVRELWITTEAAETIGYWCGKLLTCVDWYELEDLFEGFGAMQEGAWLRSGRGDPGEEGDLAIPERVCLVPAVEERYREFSVEAAVRRGYKQACDAKDEEIRQWRRADRVNYANRKANERMTEWFGRRLGAAR